ncbi:MAG: AAA family ATPase, partial [Rhodospirillaceae bacterium]|nr:AAA family ATPase [Rhodospirillaceae bacterium]
RLIGNAFDLVDLGPQEMKGFDLPVPAWQVVGEKTSDSRFDASHGLALTRFVGREAERQLLFERWRLAKGGEGQTVLLSGEAGIGKSRMVQAIREHVSAGRHYRLRYQCSPYHTNSAFHPIIQRLELVAGFSSNDDSDEKLDKLEDLLAMSGETINAAAPYFAELLSLPWEERYTVKPLTPQQIREGTIEVLIGQVLNLSRQCPVLFILEDAHWIDPSTEALIGELLVRTAGASIFFLITHRPEYEPPWPKQPHLTSIALNRLSRVQGAEIARAVGGDMLAEALIDGIVARADGVPLYVEEIARSVLEADRSGGDRATDGVIPSSLHASLTARLDRLGEAKKVAQIAAVIGREFPLKLISAVYTDANLGQMLEQLVASELVYRIRAEPEPAYFFKHALVQNAAYESLLRANRRAAHAGIAAALRDIYPEQAATSPELLALHYTEAGETDQALDYWLKSGLRANGQSAYLEAIGHLRKGLNTLIELAEGATRDHIELQLQTALASACLATDGFTAESTADAYARAQALCTKLGGDEQVYPIIYGTFRYMYGSGKHQQARDLAESTLERATEQTNSIHLMMSHRMMGSNRFAQGEFVAARKHFEQALALYDPLADASAAAVYGADFKTSYLAQLALVLNLLGYADQATEVAENEIARTKALGHAFTYCHALTWSGQAYALTRQFERIAQRSPELLALSSEHGFSVWSSNGKTIHGASLAHHGDLGEGISYLEEGIGEYRRTGAVFGLAFFSPPLAQAVARQGQWDYAGKLVVEIQDVVERTQERWFEAEVLRLQGDLALQQHGSGAAAEIEALFRRSIHVARAQEAKLWELRSSVSLGRLWQDQGKTTEARNLLAGVYSWFTEGFYTPDLMDAKALLDELS